MRLANDRPHRRSISLLAIFTSSMLLLASTAPAQAEEDEENEDAWAQLDSISDTEGTDSSTENAPLTINSLERSSDSNAVTLTYTITNERSDDVSPAFLFGDVFLYEGPAYSGVTLFDAETESRHHPLANEEEHCVCAGDHPPPEVTTLIGAEMSVSYWALYQIPDDVDSVTVEIPNYEDIDDVPISDL